MKEVPLSNCERDFLLQTIAERKRLDGRECYDYRNVKITFGIDRGCCHVTIGDTRVLAQISCQVEAPKQSRPTEGMLFVNVELSPMAAPQFEAGRQTDQCVEITRILERCIKESRCVDTESLCIMAGVKVWSIRADIHILNHEGNLIDACGIAAISALAHFRRPDVTVSGEDVTIHSIEDRDPVPLSVHHMPLCVTFAFYEQGKFLLVDPSEKEERVMDGKMVIGMNKHREICTLQLSGSMLLLKDQVLRCSQVTVVKVTELTELIKKALENDSQARARGEKFGFATSIEKKSINVTVMDEMQVEHEESDRENDIEEFAKELEKEEAKEREKQKTNIISKSKQTATIGDGGQSTWDIQTPDQTSLGKRSLKLPKPKHDPVPIEIGSEEEDDVVTMDSEDLDVPKPVKPLNAKQGKFIGGGHIDLTAALKANKKGKKSKKNT